MLGAFLQVAADELSTLTKAENLSVPAVPSKQSKAIADYMLLEAQALVKMGYRVETERNGEVIVITIPARELFNPNETELLKSGRTRLEPLASYLKVQGRFKVVLAMHSDDTGSASYKDRLTEDRLDSITEYLASISNYPDQMIGYAMADEEPLQPNNNIVNRDTNRRLEIFIVPDMGLIKKLKK